VTHIDGRQGGHAACGVPQGCPEAPAALPDKQVVQPQRLRPLRDMLCCSAAASSGPAVLLAAPFDINTMTEPHLKAIGDGREPVLLDCSAAGGGGGVTGRCRGVREVPHPLRWLHAES
jgi:hypothetical protein